MSGGSNIGFYIFIDYSQYPGMNGASTSGKGDVDVSASDLAIITPRPWTRAAAWSIPRPRQARAARCFSAARPLSNRGRDCHVLCETRRQCQSLRRIFFLGIGSEEGRKRCLELDEACGERRPCFLIICKYIFSPYSIGR